MTAKKAPKAKKPVVVSKKVTKKDVDVSAKMMGIKDIAEEADKIVEELVSRGVKIESAADIIPDVDDKLESLGYTRVHSLKIEIGTRFMHGEDEARVTSQEANGICIAMKKGAFRKRRQITPDYEIKVTPNYVKIYKI